MVSIKIGNIQKAYDEINPEWIYQQIFNRRKSNENVCIQIFIESKDTNMVLTTCDCPPPLTTGRNTTAKENEIFNLWEKMGLKEKHFEPRILIDFLTKIKSFENS